MTEFLNIVIAASEAVPYAKTGGLADVAGALPVELVKLGHRVTLVLPGYRSIWAGHHFRQVSQQFRIPIGGLPVEASLEEEQVSIAGTSYPLRVLAVRCDSLYDRSGLYQDRDGDYPDNLDRFVVFSRAIIEAVDRLSAEPDEVVDILHLHDWQTALCAVYLNAMAKGRRRSHPKTLLTLHNMGYQGIFPGAQFSRTGLDPSVFTPNGLEFYGSVNCLKGGIMFSDAVSTVSETYAKEILTAEFGCGLEGVLASRSDIVHGITNGIDSATWNPETDPHLPAHYGVADLSGKRVCKQAVQRELGLPNRDVPLLAVIGRLTPQKGFDLVLDVLSELVALDVQIAVLGTGDHRLEQEFLQARSHYPNQVGVVIGFSEGLAHRIEAGADMLMMPSRYEPCGLSQLYSLRYGTVPIVRRTGGLADTVVPFKPITAQAGIATGFHFIDPSHEALLTTLLLALRVYRDRDQWERLMRAGMNTDVSWARATQQYVRLYESLLKRNDARKSI
ncbi:MAG: glycogen synthase GlgA [Nitrospira sp.]|nr:glycogen synthase GlgA [Nitrospira sp.]